MLLSLVFLILILVGCENFDVAVDEPSDEELEKEAVRTAQGFAISWQNNDYDQAYDYLHPVLKELRSKSDFVTFATASQGLNEFSLIYDKVVLQEKDLAYAYYTFSGESTIQPKTPAIEMNFINGTWKINGFGSYFTKTCVIDDCAGILNPLLVRQSTLECMSDHPILSYDDCEEVAEEFYGEIQYNCGRSTGYKCSRIV